MDFIQFVKNVEIRKDDLNGLWNALLRKMRQDYER